MIPLTHEQLEAELNARGFRVYLADARMVAGRMAREDLGAHRARVFAFCRERPTQAWTGALLSERPCPDPKDPRPYQRDERARIQNVTDVDQVRAWIDAIVNIPEPRPIRVNNFPSFAH